MKHLKSPYAVLVLAAAMNGWGSAHAIEAQEILIATDQARGGSLPGTQWGIKMTTVDPDGQQVREMIVQAQGDNSMATTVAPPRMTGGRMLQVGRNMWYTRPELRKPISISSRQKLVGPAANGDIAATNYMSNYTATLLREEKLGNEDMYVLNLTANSKGVTYDRIVYWVSKDREVAVKADYYTVSGMLFKSAVFEYGNDVVFRGKRIPFVSKMTITDEINKGSYSVLEYYDVRLKSLSASDFSVAQMMEY